MLSVGMSPAIESDHDCTADHRLNSTTVYRKLFDLVIFVCDYDN